WVDEVVLVSIALARSRGLGLTIVYPAPAGHVGVLLAAQLLLDQFVQGNRESSVGVVTADTTMATRTWNALRIATTGAREPISEVFPAYRADPDGESPGGRHRLQGVIIGQKCMGWRVDHLVVDHLAGFVRVETAQPSIEIFADPRDPSLHRAEQESRLIWGWSKAGLSAANRLESRANHTTPFSVASERLDTLAAGFDLQLRVALHPDAEAAIKRAREDLRVLRSMAPDRTDRNLERGLSAAWHHLATLTSLPCRPSQFDRFASLPPIAARSTRVFEPELSAWARTLSGEVAEIASILASDIADLREALELGNPFEQTLCEVYESRIETLVVTRTATAAKALLDLLGHAAGSTRQTKFIVQSIRRLHRQGTWPRVLMIGEPAPWDWHRLLSGLAPSVEVLTLGQESAGSCTAAITSVETSRDHWGNSTLRNRTWRELTGRHPPQVPEPAPVATTPILVVDGAEYVAEPDPFGELASLFDLDPLDVSAEGLGVPLAREDETGYWTAEATAVAIETDRGRLLLEVGRPVDVQEGPQIIERRPELLEPGDVVLVGRRQGRVGLLEALEERLGDRPDLLAARFLIDHYHRLVRSRFQKSGHTIESLHRALVERGCDRISATVRSWVTEGTMAPQQFSDLEKLNDALALGLPPVQLRELFAGVKRRRGFRRAAGRILANAALGATVVLDENRVDEATGFSIADLREAVVEATVIEVTPCEQPVPLTLLGKLES
ncbi:MAG: hypothetical protein OXH38_03750, partial [Chloroflexi bacterium]|nr:hypothetical protein [Chloroflexota bacterium]